MASPMTQWGGCLRHGDTRSIGNDTAHSPQDCHAEDSATVSALMVLATSGCRHDTCCRGEDVDMVKPVAVASYLAA